jgi:GPH family glycoside/pentoside/hexuronide:cation symporter
MENDKVKFREQMAYALGDVGCNFVWTTIGAFLILYYTDYAGIAAAAVGTMILVLRFVDALATLLMGYIIDKTKFRMGKTRPWIAISAPFMMVAMVLIFNVPQNYDDSGKLIYAYLTYFFLTTIVYTMANVSYNTLISLITINNQEKASLSAVRFICVVPTMALIGIITPILLKKMSFGKISIIYGVLAMVLLLVCSFGTKERHKANKDEKKIPLITSIKGMFINKYFLPITIFYMLFYILNALFTGAGVYYTRDVMGDMGIFGLTQLALLPGVMISLALFTTFVKKFGKWKIMMFSLALFAVMIVPMIFAPTNVPILLVTSFFKGLAMGGALGDLFTVVADIVDYGEWKTGVRSDGLIFSSTNFGLQVGTGLGAALIGWTLAWGGYQANAVVTEKGILAAKMIYLYMPLVILALLLFVFAFCNVDKIYPKVEAYLKEKSAET